MKRAKYFLIAAAMSVGVLALQGCTVNNNCYGYYCHHYWYHNYPYGGHCWNTGRYC